MLYVMYICILDLEVGFGSGYFLRAGVSERVGQGYVPSWAQWHPDRLRFTSFTSFIWIKKNSFRG